MGFTKISVTGIAAVAIIYRKMDPSQIFIEIKDDGHPIKLVRRQLCFIGGNWIGEDAKTDKGPHETLMREIQEELSLERPARSSHELSLLGISEAITFAPTPVERMPGNDDVDRLRDLKRTIMGSLEPFGDCMNRITRKALETADPGTSREGFVSLVSYWTCALSESTWRDLSALQERFGNLSNESITLITSLDEIVRTKTKIAFGHDYALKDFFTSKGLGTKVQKLTIVPHITNTPLGAPFQTYDEYLTRYEVAKHPVAA